MHLHFHISMLTRQQLMYMSASNLRLDADIYIGVDFKIQLPGKGKSPLAHDIHEYFIVEELLF